MKTWRSGWVLVAAWLLVVAALVPGVAGAGERPLKGALVLFGKIDDASWNGSYYESARRVESELTIKFDYTESVPPADAERVIRDYASRGYDLVLGHAFAYSKPTQNVAKDFPKVAFAHGLDWDKIGPNITGYRVLFHEGGYLMGLLAGGLTKSGKIGAVNTRSIPPQVILGEAFREGVKAVNPNAQVLMSYTESFEDPVKGREAATAMVAQGADFIFAMGDGTGLGPIAVARERKILAGGVYGDQSKLAPDVIVSSMVLKWDSLFQTLVRDLRAGSFGNKQLDLSMKDGIVDLAPYYRLAERVPADLQKKVVDARADIIAGKLKVPIITQKR
jgi:basic membrane protein A